MAEIINIQNLRVEKDGKLICAIDAFALAAGKVAVAVGKNGSGKSTLLRVLAGLERDYSGTCRISANHGQRVFVHQTPYLFRGTVWSNVMYGLRAHGTAQREQIAKTWLQRFGIEQLSGRGVDQLSGGEKKRTALARAFAVGAMLILLDEPFSEMDDAGTSVIADAISNAGDATIVLTSPSDRYQRIAKAQELRITAPAVSSA